TSDRLSYVVNRSAELLNQAKTLGFAGYPTYMAAAGLRLSALQERVLLKDSSGTRKNFEDQPRTAIEFHKETISQIDESLNASTQVRQSEAAGIREVRQHPILPGSGGVLPCAAKKPTLERIVKRSAANTASSPPVTNE